MLACMFQGDEPECVNGIPGLWRSWCFRGRWPLVLGASAAHDGGDSAPDLDLAAGAATAGGALTMTKPAVEASSLQTQLGAATPKTVPKVDTTTTTGAAMTGDGNELEVVTGHPGL
jgi:hypothetical protein